MSAIHCNTVKNLKFMYQHEIILVCNYCRVTGTTDIEICHAHFPEIACEEKYDVVNQDMLYIEGPLENAHTSGPEGARLQKKYENCSPKIDV